MPLFRKVIGGMPVSQVLILSAGRCILLLALGCVLFFSFSFFFFFERDSKQSNSAPFRRVDASLLE